MEDYERTRIESLAREDPELERLWREHQELEGALEKLDALPHPTPDEELERRRLQKIKLAGRDRMAEIVAHHAEANATD